MMKFEIRKISVAMRQNKSTEKYQTVKQNLKPLNPQRVEYDTILLSILELVTFLINQTGSMDIMRYCAIE